MSQDIDYIISKAVLITLVKDDNDPKGMRVADYFIGNSISHFRKLKGMSQRELGERIGLNGSAISSYERGKSLPTFFRALLISDVLGVPADVLYKVFENVAGLHHITLCVNYDLPTSEIQ